MKQFSGSASRTCAAAAADVFDLLTDVVRLPEWNAAIEAVEDDARPLQPGTEWRVTMHPPHLPRWGSVSVVEVLDRDHLRFAYETRNADGNPSWVDWSWTVTPTDTGATVAVTWACHLETFDRRFFGGPIRRRNLAREVPASLGALARLVERAPV